MSAQQPYAAAIELRGTFMYLLADDMTEPVATDLATVGVNANTVAQALRQLLPEGPTVLMVMGTCQSGAAGWDGVNLSTLTMALQGPQVTQGTEADALATIANGDTAACVVYGQDGERWYIPAKSAGFTVEQPLSEQHDLLQSIATTNPLFSVRIYASIRRLTARHPHIEHIILWSATGLPEGIAIELWSLGSARSANLMRATLVPDPNAVLAGALKATHDARTRAAQPPKAQE